MWWRIFYFTTFVAATVALSVIIINLLLGWHNMIYRIQFLVTEKCTKFNILCYTTGILKMNEWRTYFCVISADTFQDDYKYSIVRTICRKLDRNSWWITFHGTRETNSDHLASGNSRVLNLYICCHNSWNVDAENIHIYIFNNVYTDI